MSRLLVKNIDTLVSCDNDDHVYNHVDLVCEDGRICAIRPHEDSPAVRSSSCCTSGDSSGHMPKGDAAEAEYDTVIDGTGMLCYPGLVNAHHHLYQIFSRNLPQVQNMELFDWLTTLYEVWKNLNEDTIRLSSLVGIGELMKNGCTTIFD
ncbi:MAG: amidohydrolase family protein, partial [Lachnospiraceae bacterium]|nr:amidohydrolase family protein [Lachnospiraceae bacterium]